MNGEAGHFACTLGDCTDASLLLARPPKETGQPSTHKEEVGVRSGERRDSGDRGAAQVEGAQPAPPLAPDDTTAHRSARGWWVGLIVRVLSGFRSVRVASALQTRGYPTWCKPQRLKLLDYLGTLSSCVVD